MHNCTLTGCSVIGVDICNGASGIISHTTISQVETGIMVAEPWLHLQHKCDVCGLEGGDAAAHAWAAVQRGAPAPAHSQSGPRVGFCVHVGARSRATLNDVEIWDCSYVGLALSPQWYVNADRVRVSRCVLSGMNLVTAVGSDESSFRGCSVVPANQSAKGIVSYTQIGPNGWDVVRGAQSRGIEVQYE